MVKRVLVIDDDPAVQRRCREVLEAEGFDVSCEGSLVSARRFLRHSEADLVLLDLFLPDGSGYELFARSQAMVADRPVVGMTAVYLGTANAQLIASRYPFAAILSKPLDEKALVATLHRALNGEPAPPITTVETVLPDPEHAMPELRGDALSLDEELDGMDSPSIDVPASQDNGTERPSTARSSGGWQAPRRRPESRPSTWPARSSQLLPRSSSGRRAIHRASTSASLQRPGRASFSSSQTPVPKGSTPQTPTKPLASKPERSLARADGRVIQRTSTPAAPRSPIHRRTLSRTSSPSLEAVLPTSGVSAEVGTPSWRGRSVIERSNNAPSSSSTQPLERATAEEDAIQLDLDEIALDPPPPPAGVGGPDSLLGPSPLKGAPLPPPPAPPPPEVAVPQPPPSAVQPQPAQAPMPVVPAVVAPPDLDPSRFTYQGRIDETPIAVMLAHIARRGLTGSLLLRHEQVKKIVYIEQGVPRALKSNLLSECLGRLMVREGMISEEACETSVVRLKREGRLQGELLVEMGAAQQTQVDYMVERQFDLKIIDVFGWEAGLYQFRPVEGELIEKVKQRVRSRNPFALVMEGVRANVSVERAERSLASYGKMAPVLLVPWNELQVIGLLEHEWGWMQQVDGRTLTEIVTTNPEAYQLFYALICTGLLAFQTSPG
ncbi:MAG: response regulator [Myxococcota bacterium]